MKQLILIALSLLPVFPVQAQSKDDKDNKKGAEQLKENAIREKWRKPVKISDALEAREQKKTQLKTTGTSIEKKLSNSPAGTQEGESFIALNPNNPAQLVMSYMEETTNGLNFPVYFSNDSGNTWTRSTFDALSVLGQDVPGGFVAGGGDPVFVYDQSGKLFFSWIYLALNQTHDTALEMMSWASSTNNGLSWTVAPGNNHYIGISKMDPASFDPFPGSEGFYDRQWMTADRTAGSFAGRVYVSFLYIPGSGEPQTNGGTCVKYFNPSSNSWSSKHQVYNGSSQFANVAVDNTGKLHVSFADIDNQTVMHASSTNGGQSFSAPHTLYVGSNLFGGQVSQPKVQDRENAAVNLAIDGANNLHMVWSDFDNGTTSGYSSFYSRSVDGGASWSSPADIATMMPNFLNSLMPVVSAHGSKVTIGTYGVDASDVSNYYTITSVNSGASWDTARKMSTQSTGFSDPSNSGAWFGDYFSAVRTSCKTYNIWSDGRGTAGPKMYLSINNECNPLDVPDLIPINASFSLKNIYPDPATTELNLLVKSEAQNELTVRIFHADGKLAASQVYTVVPGVQTLSLNTTGLAAGVYHLRVDSRDGFKCTRTVVKQ